MALNSTEGFESYRTWAPADSTPPIVGEGDLETFAGTPARPDVWFAVALSDSEVIETERRVETLVEEVDALRRRREKMSGRCRSSGSASD